MKGHAADGPQQLAAETMRQLWELQERTNRLTAEAERLEERSAAWDRSRWGRAHRVGASIEGGSRPRRLWRGLRMAKAFFTVPAGRVASPVGPPANSEAVGPRSGESIGDGHITRGASNLAATVRSGRRLVVAAVMDEFTRLAFDAECDIVDLHPRSWKRELASANPDLVFIESAWRGHEQSWYDLVQTRPQELVDIAAWCREHDVPSIFWNKEDPVYYDRYIKVAALFDHVFTTDVDVIKRYVRDLQHERVHVLPFAAQPQMFNPIETGPRKEAAVFAGSYYQGFKERNQSLFAQIDGCSRVLPVEIFDRNLGTDNPTLQWPAPYSELVVGTLPASKMDIAYKGYKVALNVNTVTDSQTMLSRRVFDLVSSGTPTVSNFSASLKVLFGDLVTGTNSADEIEAAVRAILDDPVTTDKKRAIGVRQILAKHTYHHRFNHLIETVCGERPVQAQLKVGVVVEVGTVAELDDVVADVGRQSYECTDLLVVSSDRRVAAECAARNVNFLSESEARSAGLEGAMPDADAVAVLDRRHWYGPHYLASLAYGLEYSEGQVAAKITHFDAAGAVVQEGQEYRWWTGEPVPWSRSLVRATVAGGRTVGSVLQPDAVVDLSPGAVPGIVGVDRFDFCVDAEIGSALELSADLPLNTGATIARLVAAEPRTSGSQLDHSAFPKDSYDPATGAGLLVRSTADGVVVAWNQDPTRPRYVPFSEPVPVSDIATDGAIDLQMRASVDGDLGLELTWLDARGSRLPGFTYGASAARRAPVPAEATAVQLFLRATGAGTALISSVSFAADADTSDLVLDGWSANTLLVTNTYPTYESPYQNGFVHSRLRSYRERGVTTDVFVMRTGEVRHREFGGVQVLTGDEDLLRTVLASGRYQHILVHFLSEWMWSVLHELRGSIPITVWIHGFEIEPWWRRTFNYATELELETAKRESEARMEFWREISESHSDDISFVFVSNSFRSEVIEDQRSAGFELAPATTHVIPNPIDTGMFSYTPKDAEQRKRILLIRPFTGQKYANDLAVAAIRDLSREPWFFDLTFSVFGDGSLFEEQTAALAAYPNVFVQRRFLSHREIASLHKSHGVFLVPTRHDTQGVSRDEAMASGLVPVTSKIPTVCEFLSDEEGYLAPEEDPRALADAIREMYHHPEVFLAKSAAAARRIRRTISADILTPLEMQLFERDPQPSPPTGMGDR